MKIPAELRYTTEHEWVRQEEGGRVTVGITDYAQAKLGDVVFVDLPPLGRKVRAGDSLAVVESVKAVSDVYAPVSGEVVAVNPALGEAPELVNQDPYGQAWLVVLAVTGEQPPLLTAEAYAELVAAEGGE